LLGLRASLAPKVLLDRLGQSVLLALPDRLALPGLPAVLLALPAQQVLRVQPERQAQLDRKALKVQLAPRVPQVRLDHRVGLLDRQGLQVPLGLLDRLAVVAEAEVESLRIPVLLISLPFLGQLRLIP
jgi:hypothetical protein